MDSSPFHPDELMQHRDALRRMARGIIGETESAEDVVQSTFLSALESPRRSPDSLRAWLMRILRSRAVDVLRSRSRRQDAERLLIRESRASNEELDQHLDGASEVVEAVRDLGDSYRRVILLRYFEDLPPREIAKRLDLPLASVKTQLARALEKLRERMARSHDGDRNALALVLAPLARSTPAHTVATPPIAWEGIIMLKKLSWVAAALLVTLATWYLIEGRAAEPLDETEVSAETAISIPKEVPSNPVEDPHATLRSAVSTEEEPEEIEPTRGALVIRALWSDGTPAAGLGFRIQSVDDPLVGRSTRGVVTDSEGLARVQGLAAGVVLLESDRVQPNPGQSVTAEVVAGEERTLVFKQAAGVAVQGTVVDEQGRPVAAAGIWLANAHRDWRGGRVVSVSDVDGSFDLRGVGPEQSVGAIASGFQPSKLVDLDLLDANENPRIVRLQLRDGGAALAGLVLDSAGEAVHGARVAVGLCGPYDSTRPDGSTIEKWTPRVLETDKNGAYEFSGLAIGLVRLTVLSDGFAEHREDVELTAGSMHTADVWLDRGVRVHGVVRTEDGKPIAGAIVLALDKPFVHPVPTQGPFEVAGAFHCPAVRSDAQGAFVLPPVPAGEVHLYASKGAHFWSGSTIWDGKQAAFVGATQETLQAVAGNKLEWNPVLRVGPSIHGRVTYADGSPMVWVSVTALDEATGERFQDSSTDHDGSFSIPGLRDVPYTLSVWNDEAPADAEPLREARVWPGDERVELVASWSRSRAAVGTIEGRWRDSAGRLSSATAPVFLLEDDPLTGWEHAVLDGDRFRFDHVSAGRYRVRVMSEDDPVQSWEWFDLAAGQVLDLGVLETEPGGTLHVELERSDATRNTVFELRVVGPELYYPTTRQVEAGVDSVTIEGLAPGSYQLRFARKGIAPRPLDIQIEANQVLEVTKAVEEGVRIPLAVSNSGGHDWGELSLTVREGDELHEEMSFSSRRLTLPYTLSVSLPLGRFDVVARTDTGLFARQSIEVRSLTEPATAVQLELK